MKTRLVLTKLETPEPGKIERPVVMVHGFGYDPASWGKDNPNNSLFPLWASRMHHRSTIKHEYYSSPPGVKHVLKAWWHGRYNRYRYAWDLAQAEGEILREVIRSYGEEVDIIAHSLGTRVVRSALQDTNELPVKRVLLLNGAETTKNWDDLMSMSHIYHLENTEIMNVCVRTDDVLSKFGGLFSPGTFYSSCIGQTGLLGTTSNWYDLRLNGAGENVGNEFGWDLRGNNPEGYLDHWYSYLYPENWKMYNAWLDGRMKLVLS